MRVSPGMLAAKVIVAPNSPHARAKPKIVPAKIPGAAKGSVIRRMIKKGLRPKVLAASSHVGSIASRAIRMARTISGSAITPAASAAAFHVKAKETP